MKTHFAKRWGKQIWKWIGEASFGCLENSFLPLGLPWRMTPETDRDLKGSRISRHPLNYRGGR